jgi:hypothetical protein
MYMYMYPRIYIISIVRKYIYIYRYTCMRMHSMYLKKIVNQAISWLPCKMSQWQYIINIFQIYIYIYIIIY